MVTRLQLMLLLLPTITEAGFFMQIFADAGLEVTCPSGNLVYIHPISEDLQQCDQQIGNYNESTCPGGTACERFPVFVPGFQDYCCWINKTDSEAVESASPSTKESPSFSRRGTADRGVVEAIIERPESQESGEKEEELEEVSTVKTRARVRTTTPLPEDEDSSEGEEEKAKQKTKRPRNRKPSTTTTTTTTTTKPASHGLPQCNDPSNSVFIDYGNRLRDCYFQRCERGYNCEFNKKIRRFICCGQDLGLVPPPGLPMLPAPKPLNPLRGLRPNPRPFAMQSDGTEDSSSGRYHSRSSCCDVNDCSGERNGENGCRSHSTRCPNVQNFPFSSCKNGNAKEKLIEYPHEQPRQEQRPNGVDWSGDDCNKRYGGCSESPGLKNMERGNIERYEWVKRRVESPDTLRPGCSNMNPGFEGCAESQHERVLVGSPFKRIGNNENPNKMDRTAESFSLSTVQRPHVLEEFMNRERIDFTPTPNFPPRPFDEHRRAVVSSSLIPRKMNRLSTTVTERQSPTAQTSHAFSSVSQEINPFVHARASPRKASTQRTPVAPSRQETIVCAAGTEYNLDGLIPSCNSDNRDFCPSSHPHCSFSSSVPHRACCARVILQTS